MVQACVNVLHDRVHVPVRSWECCALRSVKRVSELLIPFDRQAKEDGGGGQGRQIVGGERGWGGKVGRRFQRGEMNDREQKSRREGWLLTCEGKREVKKKGRIE